MFKKIKRILSKIFYCFLVVFAVLIWESFFKSSNLDNVSNGNDAISTMNNLSIIFDITFLALGTSIALVTSWIIFLPISRPLLKIPKLLFRLRLLNPLKQFLNYQAR